MLATGRFEPGFLLLTASLGNVLSSTINWALGRFLARHRGARWFPVSEAAMVKAERRYRRFGELSLLRSEEHTSELQSLMRNSYAVFCLKKQTTTQQIICIIQHLYTYNS